VLQCSRTRSSQQNAAALTFAHNSLPSLASPSRSPPLQPPHPPVTAMSIRQTAFKLVVAGGIAVASGLLALYKFSLEPIVLEDPDGLGLLPGSSSMAGGSITSSGSSSPDVTSLKPSPARTPQTGMSRLGSFSTLATLAEEDEEDEELGSPLRASAVTAATAAVAAESASNEEEELDWGDEPDSPLPLAKSASGGGGGSSSSSSGSITSSSAARVVEISSGHAFPLSLLPSRSLLILPPSQN